MFIKWSLFQKNKSLSHNTLICLFFMGIFINVSVFLQYLLKVNEIKLKKGVDFLQNLIQYYHAQCK